VTYGRGEGHANDEVDCMLARCDRSQCKNIPKLAWREVTRVDGDQGRLGAVPVTITNNVDGAQEDGDRSKIRSTVLKSRRSDGIEIRDSRRAQGANQARWGGVLDEIVSGEVAYVWMRFRLRLQNSCSCQPHPQCGFHRDDPPFAMVHVATGLAWTMHYLRHSEVSAGGEWVRYASRGPISDLCTVHSIPPPQVYSGRVFDPHLFTDNSIH
jgi:hypothetical protein